MTVSHKSILYTYCGRIINIEDDISILTNRQGIKSVIIELLKVRIPPEQREKYIQKDAEIWTAALAKHRGFLGKEVWINPNDSTEVVLVIQWATKEDWKAISQIELEDIERKFTTAMGKSYPIVESSEYQVRKFPQK